MTVNKFLLGIKSQMKPSNKITISTREKFNSTRTKLLEFKYYNVIKTEKLDGAIYDKGLARKYKKYKGRSIHKMTRLDNGDIEIVIPYWRN